MEVHNTLGNGFQEVIYQRCLSIEFDKASLNYGREVEQTIIYKGLLINFGANSLQYKLIFNPKYNSE